MKTKKRRLGKSNVGCGGDGGRGEGGWDVRNTTERGNETRILKVVEVATEDELMEAMGRRVDERG